MEYKTPRVLIIDDDPSLLKTMGDILKLKGFEPVKAQTGGAALTLLEERQTEVALIDLRLNDMSGLDLLSAIKLRSPETECIMLTGHATRDAAIQAIQKNAFGFFLKPVDMEQALLAIQRAVEKYQAARALRESEEAFRSYFNSGAVGTCVTSPDKRWLEMNDRLCQMLGYPRKELSHATWVDLTHPEDLQADLELFEQVLSGRRDAYELDKRFIRKDGKVIHVSMYVTCQRNEDGSVRHFLTSLVDMTARKQAEDALRRSEENLKKAQRYARVGSWTWEIPTNRLEWSDEMYEIFGIEKDTFTGSLPDVIARAIHPDDREKVEASNRNVAEDGKPIPLEYRVVHEDGTQRVVWGEAGELIFNPKGQPVLLSGIVQDITERKRAEKITQARLRLNLYANSSEVDDFLQKVLDEAEALTESQIGFFHFIDADQNAVHLQTWSTNTLANMCSAEGKGQHYPLNAAGIWADAVRDKEPRICNDYPNLPKALRRGMPEGHAPVTRLVSVPLIKEDKVVAVMGVGNKTASYEQSDIDALLQLLGDTWDTIMRKLAEKALARSNQRLQSLRMIDHALLSARAEGASAEMEALRHLAALVPCGMLNIVALDEITGYAKIIARAEGAETTVHRVEEPIEIAGLRLSELSEDGVCAKKLTEDNATPVEQKLCGAEGRALVKAPLVVHGNLIGVLALGSPNPEFFDAEDLEIIKDVSAQLALSLHHNNLLNQVRSHAGQLEMRVQERTAELEAIRQRFELAVNAGEIGVWEINLKENKHYWNERMYRIHGLEPREAGAIENKSCWEMIHPQDMARFQGEIEDALKLTGLLITEHRIVRGDGSLRYVSINAVVLYDEQRTPDRMAGVTVDVTERHEAEEAMRRANLEMERALRIKDEFLANMSHELRTPLNAVMGISESLLEETAGKLNDKQRKYVATINESGAHLLALINDILDLSKIEAGRMDLNVVNVPIKTLFDSGFRMVKEMAQKKNVSISFEKDELAQSVRGDSRRLLQMLVNLLSNAVKFTPEGGKAGLQVTTHPEANEIHFSVWDTGIGIAEENMPRLFQPFVQLDSSLAREHAGTGLGLMLVMQMARLHGGNVAVESQLNVGSRFTVSLPWSQTDQNVAAADQPEARAAAQPSKTNRAGNILIVEDTEAVVALLDDYLKARGHRVRTARDGLSGLELAKNEGPDLILLDIQMPGMNGFEVVQKLRADEALKNIPVIALTALAMPGDRERCLAAGMTDYISKPVRLREFIGTVEKHLK